MPNNRKQHSDHNLKSAISLKRQEFGSTSDIFEDTSDLLPTAKYCSSHNNQQIPS